MKSNIIDTINKAKKEYESNNKQLYSRKVRELAYEYMSKNNVDTLNIKNGKHTISFHKGNPDTPNSITVIIDNKFYSGNLMDAKLCELDHIGVEFTEARKKMERNSKIKDNVKASSRVVKVDLTRKVINTPISAASEGKSLLQSLMQLVGHTMSKAMQSR